MKTFFSFLLVFCASISWGQSKTVTGKIISSDSRPLAGATVQLKNSKSATTSGKDGMYSISVPSGSSAVLVISYVGYDAREVDVTGTSQANVTLNDNATGMNAVVVVGYGSQKKSDIISSVASIKPESATRNATLDVGEMLRGMAAGVFVTTNDAGPGGSSNILIRGRSSISGGTNPIVIADGVRIGAINDLNPNDIESIEVLKDASAQAIYGARASNGVILITTKRGKSGKLVMNYNGYYGTQTAHHTGARMRRGLCSLAFLCPP